MIIKLPQHGKHSEVLKDKMLEYNFRILMTRLSMFSAQEALKMAFASIPDTSPSTHSPVPSVALGSRPPEAPRQVPGTPDSAATVRDLPQRYRRKPLALDEMDYIQVRAVSIERHVP